MSEKPASERLRGREEDSGTTLDSLGDGQSGRLCVGHKESRGKLKKSECGQKVVFLCVNELRWCNV